jgi:PKHD-type hydroxylase
MLLAIPAVLAPDQVALARSWLEEERFVDGKLSAGAAASRVKANEELDRASGGVERIDRLVMENLTRHPLYRSAALPLRAASPLYARYRPGMTYGEHLDDPIMGAEGLPYRSDIAVTLFLSAPDEYDGGELAIRTAFGEQAVKLPAGDAVLYPSGSIHRVRPVTRGERLVAVTWVQSLVRDPARRELLPGLTCARERLLQDRPAAEEAAQVNAAYLNLIRMWSEL